MRNIVAATVTVGWLIQIGCQLSIKQLLFQSLNDHTIIQGCIQTEMMHLTAPSRGLCMKLKVCWCLLQPYNQVI